MILTIDFETRSRFDIYNGVHPYAAHESTEVLCLSVKEDDKPTRTWLPMVTRDIVGHEGSLSSSDLVKLAREADEIHAHNAQFERLIWEACMPSKFLKIPLNKWRCTAALVASYGLPRSLANACEALDLPVQKDKVGYAVMMRLCKPKGRNRRGAGDFDEDPQAFHTLIKYCEQDVEAEYTLNKAIHELPRAEQNVWLLDQKINDKGIPIDVENVHTIIGKVEAYEARLLVELQEVSDGVLSSVSAIEQVMNWLSKQGCVLENLQKPTVAKALAGDLPNEKVRRVLELRQTLGKSSVAKYKKILECISEDERVRGTLVYHGAATGRWSGRLVQPQNLPRSDNAEADLFELIYLEDEETDVIDLASKSVRAVIRAEEGSRFLVGDFKQIEARVLAWLAGQADVLQAFSEGEDLYVRAAANIFGLRPQDVSGSQRQIGKTAELALGYGGGIAAFATFAENYGVDFGSLVVAMEGKTSKYNEGNAKSYLKNSNQMTEGEKHIYEEIHKEEWRSYEYLESLVDEVHVPQLLSLWHKFMEARACDAVKIAWRESRSHIAALWKKYENATIEVVENGGVLQVGQVYFTCEGKWLYIKLPSGRILSYYEPTVVETETPWGAKVKMLSCMRVNSITKRWERRKYYGGLWVENVTQAVARDLMANAMIRLDDKFPIIMTAHDEVVSEVPYDSPSSLIDFQEILCDVPAWARGMPLDTDCWEGKRYKKA